MGRKLSHSALARALGITRQAVSALARRGMPLTSVGDAEEWRLKNLDQTRVKADRPPGKAAAATDAQFREVRFQRASALAELARMKADEERGDLVRAEETRHILGTAATSCRQVLDQLASCNSYRFIGLGASEAHRVLRDVAAEALAEIHRILGVALAKLPGETPVKPNGGSNGS